MTAAHLGVGLDPPPLDGQPSVLSDGAPGLHSPGDQDQIPLGAAAASQPDPASVVDSLHLHLEMEDYPFVLEPSFEPVPGRITQPGGLGAILDAHQGDRQAPPSQRRRSFGLGGRKAEADVSYDPGRV
jgi:hypothetical protein